MYRLVTYGLIALATVAAALMLTGAIAHTPLSFVLSLAVLCGVAYGANRLFGWLFSVRTHGESALITGFILAFLFSPPDDVVGFVKLALVAVIAMASKYVIAPRGRHIFNPAAIAVVIASISGLAYAGWWVATPAMIPLTLVVGFLILRRTQKHFVALVFVAAACALLLVQGTDPVTALVSWPLFFIGAIMLTEPLTLPPRVSQQYAVAALTGILMTLPLQYGRVTMTPALALVIGNIVGWWFGQRRAIKLRFAGKKQMTETTYEITFDVSKLDFVPGQYIELTLPHKRADSRGQRRVFSIVAHPGDEQVSIGVKVPAKPSSFKKALMGLRQGDVVYATRVAGDFVLPADRTVPVVCIAGGIGVTPFVSYCLSDDRPMRLIYAVHGEKDLSFIDTLRHHDVDVTVVAPEKPALLPDDWRYVSGRLSPQTLMALIDVKEQPAVYVSGPPAMVHDVRHDLRRMGIARVKVDEFSGY